jgi:anhydro-N-acetylmuramic acid kinase
VQRKGQLLVGLMSGTSADGIDAVVSELWVRGRGLEARLLAHVHTPFTPKLRRALVHAGLRGNVREICELNFELGERFALAALGVLHEAGLKPAHIAAIGSHGQTVHHLPRARIPSTLQIGDAAVIAERTRITTIADFRVRDMAAGGQGAPLVPYADWALFAEHTRPRVVQNIGGIANLTFLPSSARLEDVLAFDTGPGNMIIDGVVSALSRGRQSFDRGGRRSDKGRVCEPLLAQLLTHPFFRRSPPKTTGREEFGEPFIKSLLAFARRRNLSPNDTIATATALTASSIAESYRRFIFPMLKKSELAKLQVILGGGGTNNRALLAMLRARVIEFDVTPEWLTHEHFGIPNQAKEALAFAILAFETLNGRSSNVPRATGARRPVILGNVTPGQ